MASGGVGSATLYRGKVECVKKSFGFITLDNNIPVSRAFFDKHCIWRQKPDDLTDEFTAGTKIQARIALTDGQHKVIYKAIDIRIVRGNEEPTKLPKAGGDEFLRHHMKNGARQLDKLATDLSTIQSNCPRFLRKNDTEEILSIVLRRFDWFVMKNGFVCLKEIEDSLVEEIMEKIDDYNGKIPFDAMTQVIAPDHANRKYLHSAEQWNVGIKDFVSRNSHVLIYWDEHIWSKKYLFCNCQHMKRFQQDLLAVLYYSQYVNGPMQVKSLSGHFNQASIEVKEVCKPKESDFKEFLERNSFFFVLRSNSNLVHECPAHRLSCISNSWQSKKAKTQSVPLCTVKPTAKSRKSSEPKSPTTDPSSPFGTAKPTAKPRKSSEPKSTATDCSSPFLKPITRQRDTENPISKAFSDMQAEFLSPKFSLVKCGQQDFCRQTTETVSPFLFESHQGQGKYAYHYYPSYIATNFGSFFRGNIMTHFH